jgi:two-component system response regulator AtoC
MESIKILVVEDAPGTRDYLTELVQIIGYQAHAVKAKAKFVSAFRRYSPDMLLLGSSHHVGHVRAFVEVVEGERSGTPILFIRDGSSPLRGEDFPETANIAFLPKSFDTTDLKQAIQELVGAFESFDHKALETTLVGQAPAMVKIKKHVVRLSQSDVTVLITGESGTGKELVARAIHKLSPRANKPFIKVNCAALPSTLLESELFGFEKGAFTGAFQRKPGKFALAHAGTILLDEISELPPPMQAKFLQVLQDDEVASLGSIANTKVDTRVLVATNADLSQMVRQGQFRSDLFFRINVVSINIPPLRERKEDIDLLCEYCLKKYAGGRGKGLESIKTETKEWFYEYHWPGNVRELQNFIQGMSVLGDEEGFSENIGKNGRAHAFLSSRRALPPPQTPTTYAATRSLKEVGKAAVRKAESAAIVEALSYTQWNRKKAAVLLNVSYKALLNKVKEYGIEAQTRELLEKGYEVDDHGAKVSG